MNPIEDAALRRRSEVVVLRDLAAGREAEADELQDFAAWLVQKHPEILQAWQRRQREMAS